MTNPEPENGPLDITNEQQTRFYLIFEEVAKSDAGGLLDATPEEIDEIEQVRRMVMDVTDERPIFMTTT
jgi:hypothetical protein